MSETEKKIVETTTNKNSVKISLDEYNDLVKRAAEPVVRNVTTILKTDAQNASDNKAFGIILGCLGSALVFSGVFLYRHGSKIQKKVD